MFRKILLPLAVVCVLVAPGQARQNQALADLKTTPEATGYKATSTYDDVVKFMKAVDAASPLVFYTTYGKTYEGREMPMAVVGTALAIRVPANAIGWLLLASAEILGVEFLALFYAEASDRFAEGSWPGTRCSVGEPSTSASASRTESNAARVYGMR